MTRRLVFFVVLALGNCTVIRKLTNKASSAENRSDFSPLGRAPGQASQDCSSLHNVTMHDNETSLLNCTSRESACTGIVGNNDTALSDNPICPTSETNEINVETATRPECPDCIEDDATTDTQLNNSQLEDQESTTTVDQPLLTTMFPTTQKLIQGSLSTFVSEMENISDLYASVVSIDSAYYANDGGVFVNKTANLSKAVQEVLWPVKKEAVVEGDVIIGGLMMVHEREESITCGPVMPQGGIQALEAMLYTIDQINLNSVVTLPNITLGAHVLDDCDKDTYGLEMAVDFIKERKSRGEVIRETRKIIRISVDKNDQELWRTLHNLKKELEGDREVVVHHLRGMALTRWRKMMEAIFHHTETKIDIYTTRPPDKESEKVKKVRETAAILIDGGAEEYKDVLKKIKTAIGGSEAAKEIANVRSTKEGKVLVTTSKNDKAIKEIKGKIDRIEGVIDALADAKEVQAALERETGEIEDGAFSISELRNGDRDTQSVTVGMKKEKAEELLGKAKSESA